MKTPALNDDCPWIKRKGGLVQIDADLMPEHMMDVTLRYVAEKNGVSLFEGEVDHGYPLVGIKDPLLCPTCGGKTAQQTAEFIYTTSTGTRAMYVPAGWFCTSCPTVVVDERMVAKGMVVSKSRFRRVIGVVNAETKDPMYFSTWRGEKPVYFLDENEQIEDMLIESELKTQERLRPHAPPASARADLQKKKDKRKQARKARKRNRGSK